MSSYRLYPRADQQQDRIWQYTAEQWSIEQADIYIQGLHNHFVKLANKEKLWRKLPQTKLRLSKDAWFSHYEKHFVFFRALPNNTIGIISILHEVRDIPTQLRKDLNRI